MFVDNTILKDNLYRRERGSMTRPAYLTQLTPLSFLERSAAVYPDKTAIIHGDKRLSYRQFAEETIQLARALKISGIQPGERVAYLCPNIPELLVAHFAVPLAGAILVAINTRLASEEIRYICNHAEAKLLIVDTELTERVSPVVGALETVTRIVTVDDIGVHAAVDAERYDEFVARGAVQSLPWQVDDELATISVNYTSGTTGRPKGVMYSHRGAYLNALGEVIHSQLGPGSVYLWTLPMFHCNGWCTTWAVTAVGGTHVCLRTVEPAVIWQHLKAGITHLYGAPTVLNMMVNAPQAERLEHPLTITTAGAPPSPTIISATEALGAQVVHAYGLTETYGPHTVCEPQASWADLDSAALAERRGRQGVNMIHADPVRVVDEDMNDVPQDGQTLGEVVMRGNNVMKGYLGDESATEQAFRGGWFHSGDLGVWHPDGYIELRDRAKDIIVSGGENISTIELERALVKHPAVAEAAVIGVPDERWGERPKAFVVLKKDQQLTAEALKAHVRDFLAGYKVPDQIAFVDKLPTTSTGKVQKFALREKEWEGRQKRIN